MSKVIVRLTTAALCVFAILGGCGPRIRTVKPGERTGPQTAVPLSAHQVRSPETEQAAAAAAHERLRNTPGYDGPDKPELPRWKPLGDIIVTAGTISQPHRILGTVSVNTANVVRVDVGRAVAGAITGTRTTKLPSTPDASLSEMYERLRRRAREVYGFNADGVINATYHVEPDGDTFADGVAIEFLEGQRREPPNSVRPPIKDRLRTLEGLREAGLISEDEFSRKKAQILDEL